MSSKESPLQVGTSDSPSGAALFVGALGKHTLTSSLAKPLRRWQAFPWLQPWSLCHCRLPNLSSMIANLDLIGKGTWNLIYISQYDNMQRYAHCNREHLLIELNPPSSRVRSAFFRTKNSTCLQPIEQWHSSAGLSQTNSQRTSRSLIKVPHTECKLIFSCFCKPSCLLKPQPAGHKLHGLCGGTFDSSISKR